MGGKKLDRIKNIFKGFSWSKNNWPSIERSLNITKLATDDGVNNIPGSNANSIEQSEAAIVDKYTENFTKDDLTLNDKLQDLEAHYNEQKTHETGKYDAIVDDADDSCQNALGKSKKEIASTENSEKDEYKALKAFRITEKLTGRTSHFKLRSWCLFGVLFFIILESLLNSQFLGQFAREGWQQALPFTLGIALVNVGLSYIVGDYALRQFWHNKILKRIIGGFFVLLWVIVIINVNGTFANYRAALNSLDSAGVAIKEVSSVASSQALSNNKCIMCNRWALLPGFNNYTIDHETQETEKNELGTKVPTGPKVMKSIKVEFDFNSGLLMILGLLFALIGLLDGFLADDPYPGYGKKVRNYQSPRKKIFKEIQDLAKSINGFLGLALQNIKEERIKADSAKDIKLAIIEKLEDIFTQRNGQIETYETKANFALKKYRDTNKQARNNKAPKYFSEKWAFPDTTRNVKEKFKSIYVDFGDYLFNKPRKIQHRNQLEEAVRKNDKNAKEEINKSKKKYNAEIDGIFVLWNKEGDKDFDPPTPRGGPVAALVPKIEPELKVVQEDKNKE